MTVSNCGLTNTFIVRQAETNHPAIKAWYKRTDRKKYPAQIAKIERRRSKFRRLKTQFGISSASEAAITQDEATNEDGFCVGTESQYFIGKSKRFHNLSTTFSSSAGLDDPAIDVMSHLFLLRHPIE
jgi:hypothetical protein